MTDIKSTSDLLKFAENCRKKGISKIKFDGNSFEIELLSEAPPSNYKKKLNEVQSEVLVESPYSDTDAIFWSSTGIPETKEAN